MSGSTFRVEPDDQKLHEALLQAPDLSAFHLPGDDVDADVMNDFLEMVHDVLGAWARGEPMGAGDVSSRVLAAQIPAYAALGRLYRIIHESAALGEGGQTWLVHVEAATRLLRDATDRMAEAARLRALADA